MSLREKTQEMSVITSSIKYVRFGSALADIVIYSTGAPERAALFQFLFTYYTSDFQYTSRTSSTEIFRWLCSRLKICVLCRRRVLVEDFVEWSEIYHLLLNGYKTRERPTSERVQLDGPWLSWDRMSVWCT